MSIATPSQGFFDLAFSPNDSALLASGIGGEIWRWNLDSQKAASDIYRQRVLFKTFVDCPKYLQNC
jgi:hypothetical protein